MKPRVYHYIAYNTENGEAKDFRALTSINIFGEKCACLYEGSKMICNYTVYGKYNTMKLLVKQQVEREYPYIAWDVRKVAWETKPFPASMYLELVKNGTI